MTYTPDERDLAIRTMLAEAGGKDGGGVDGLLAVANVIRNRVASGNYGDGLGGVVTKKYAFEPMLHYGTGKGNDPARFNPAEPEYQQAGRLLDTVMAGGAQDNTGGATHFIAHKLQGDLGRETPSWAQGKPLATIGGHSFYAPEGKVDSDTLDPQVVAALAEKSTPTAGQQEAQRFQQQRGSGAPSAPTPGKLGPMADLFKQLGQAGGGAGGQQQQNVPFLQRMIWGDKGFNGALGGVTTPNNGQGLLGGLFGGPQAFPSPPGVTAPQTPGTGTGGIDTVPPVTPIESSPLAAPGGVPLPPPRPGGADAPSLTATGAPEMAANMTTQMVPIASPTPAAPAFDGALAGAAPAMAAPAMGEAAGGLGAISSLFSFL